MSDHSGCRLSMTTGKGGLKLPFFFFFVNYILFSLCFLRCAREEHFTFSSFLFICICDRSLSPVLTNAGGKKKIQSLQKKGGVKKYSEESGMRKHANSRSSIYLFVFLSLPPPPPPYFSFLLLPSSYGLCLKIYISEKKKSEGEKTDLRSLRYKNPRSYVHATSLLYSVSRVSRGSRVSRVSDYMRSLYTATRGVCISSQFYFSQQIHLHILHICRRQLRTKV